jgi:peptide subunit release factor 1 (eRF1)
LAALPEHHNLFHKVSNNPFLLEEGIPKNPESLSYNDLVKMAWEVMEPVYLLKVKNLAEEFEQAKANNKGSEDMEAIIYAMEEGRVATILIESGKIIPGKAIASYSVGFGNGAIDNLETDDLLDDLADLAKKMGADALIIPKEDMPSKTGLAAIFRY